MTTAELKEYLGMVVDVEKELYTQRTLEKTMQNKIEIFRQSQEITFENYCRIHGITERNFTPRKGKPIKPEKPFAIECAASKNTVADRRTTKDF